MFFGGEEENYQKWHLIDMKRVVRRDKIDKETLGMVENSFKSF